uniref:Nlr family card domain protein n=1 Tax=Rhipicephalus appendiculatus TaxID=34631 RepID=A0A131YNY1_RHIAP
MLADTLQNSRTLCDLSFYPDDYKSAVLLVRKLSPSFSANYTLLSMRLSKRRELGADWFTVADVVRRNFSLVTRAAHFVAGTRHKYCAAAAELVHFNPGLVTKVQELASVDEGEAVLRIKNSLKSFSELDEFMRMAGVVKESVACHRRDDGQTQLVDLGRDCWLCIRQYLKVGDILDPQ